MCGILGFYGFEDKNLLDKMSNVLIHRGPDDSGYFQDKDIMLGHRRLSIIDLSKNGRQPMSNEEGSIRITYNGEIYNFMELRKELEQKGHRFFSRTDTEVIIHAYEEYGEECIKKFNGMFAFAIWDSNKKQLFLARDRLGIKPLYYTFVEEKFLFASEIKALLQYEQVKREVDLDGLHMFINMRYTSGKTTMFKNILSLLPAHYIIVNKNGIVKYENYHSYTINHEYNSEDYFLKKLEETLAKAVERHMISDVPIGIYLSGGMDSTTILSIASKLTEKTIKTYTMGFGEDTDELEQARKVADFYGTDHKETVIRSDLLYDFPKMIWHMDAPKRNLWSYYISELASKYNKVMLNGTGGDEFLGGYDYRYHNFMNLENLKKSISQADQVAMTENAKNLINIYLKNGALDQVQNIEYLESLSSMNDPPSLYLLYSSIDRCYDKNSLQKIYGSKIVLDKLLDLREIYSVHFKDNNLHLFDQIMLSDLNFKLSNDFLPLGDALSMAHSVEDRFPFLDNEYTDFAINVPWDVKFKNMQGKYLLRKLMNNRLPKEILTKKKQGFAPNAYNIYTKELKDIAKSILPDGEIIKKGYFQKDYILKILEKNPSPSLLPHYNLIWKLAGFEIWHKIFISADEIKKPSNINQFL